MIRNILFACAVLILLAGCSYFEPAEYHFSEEATGLTQDVRVGDLITVTLPAGDDPACFWKPGKGLNPDVLLTLDIIQGKARKHNTGPLIPVIQFRYRVLAEGFSGIALEYEGPVNEDGESESKRFNLLVRATGKPLELQDIFEEGKPPEIMTDSKGNIIPKTANLR